MTLSKDVQKQKQLSKIWVANAGKRRARVLAEGGWALSLLLEVEHADNLRALMQTTGKTATALITELVARDLKRRQAGGRATSPVEPISDSR